MGIPWLLTYFGWAPALSDPLPFYLSRIFVFGPGLAALRLASLTRKGSLRPADLLCTLRPLKTDIPLLIVVAIVFLFAASAAFLVVGLPASDLTHVARWKLPLLLADVLLQTLVVGVGEELGWRG